MLDKKVDKLEYTLDTHMTSCDQKFGAITEKLVAVDDRAQQLIASQQSLTESQKETNKSLRELTEEAKGVIKVFSDFQGAARVTGFLTKASKWVIGTPIFILGALEVVKTIAAALSGG